MLLLIYLGPDPSMIHHFNNSLQITDRRNATIHRECLSDMHNISIYKTFYGTVAILRIFNPAFGLTAIRYYIVLGTDSKSPLMH